MNNQFSFFKDKAVSGFSRPGQPVRVPRYSHQPLDAHLQTGNFQEDNDYVPLFQPQPVQNDTWGYVEEETFTPQLGWANAYGMPQ